MYTEFIHVLDICINTIWRTANVHVHVHVHVVHCLSDKHMYMYIVCRCIHSTYCLDHGFSFKRPTATSITIQ